jgi:hypothetical protein
MLRRIEDLVRRRSASDRRMGYVWMLAPILPIIVGIALIFSIVGIIVSNLPNLQSIQGATSAVPAVAAILSLYFLGIAAFYLILLIDSVSVYYLFDRRNKHFRRQQQLFVALSEYFMTRSNPHVDSVSALSDMAEDLAIDEENRPASIWAILNLFVSPVVGLIAAYILTQDLGKHEERQQNYQTALQSELAQEGVTVQALPQSRIHKRDPLLFLILTAITGGLFWIYWFYTLLKDYNEHFQDQASFEDQVLISLKPNATTMKCQTCGGSVPADAKFCPFCGKSQA